jgi:hypothetical protein
VEDDDWEACRGGEDCRLRISVFVSFGSN